MPPHSRTLTLGPGQRTTFLLPDLIPEILPEINILPPRFVLELGQVRVESDLPIAVASVDVLVPDGKIVGGTVVALD